MRKRFAVTLCATLGVFAGPRFDWAAVQGEQPVVELVVNAPGWITIHWEHTGKNVGRFVIERQRGSSAEGDPIAASYNRTDSVTDRNLQPDTEYGYRVCAEYSSHRQCSGWKRARTMSPDRPSPSGASTTLTQHEAAPDSIRIWWTSAASYGLFNVRWGEKGRGEVQDEVDRSGSSGSYLLRNLLPDRTYLIKVQGCNRTLLGSSCGYWSNTIEVATRAASPPAPTAPMVTTSAVNEHHIVLTWAAAPDERLTRTTVDRDGQRYLDRGGDLVRVDDAKVRANTEYRYRVCRSNEVGTACSMPVTAMARPVPPSAPADVTFSRNQSTGSLKQSAAAGRLSDAVRIRNHILARWRNTDIPGQFITLEREDRMQLDRLRVGPAWVEIARVVARTAPTDLSADVTPAPSEVGTSRGNRYRVCAVVPVLGAAGTACSPPGIVP